MIEKKRKNLFDTSNPEIYNEAVKTLKEKDVQVVNFEITRKIANVIKSMYGPKGLNKMIIPITNETEITQKGDKVVKAFKNRLPITLMLIELMKAQEEKCGDGTKTAFLFTALLLDKSNEMISLGISPQTINNGFSLALNKALEVLEENMIPFNEDSDLHLRNILTSVMNHKISYQSKDYYRDLILKMLECNRNLLFKSKDFDFTDVLFRKVQGKSVYDSEVINGMIVYKDKPNLSLPNKFLNAKILLIQRSLDFFVQGNQEPLKEEVEIDSVDKYQQFSQFNNNYYKKLAEFFKQKEVDIILCQKKINSSFIDYCASMNIVALELVGENEIKKLSKLLDIPVISSTHEFTNADLGVANSVEFKKIANDEMLFINVENSKILTFLVRGGTSQVTDELEEILYSSLRVAIQTVKDKKYLPGGGALDCEISRVLKNYATEFPNKYQMVIREYAKAIENLPGYLIINSAEDPLDLIPQLRAEHSNGQRFMGFDCKSNKLVDVVNEGILDGYTTKKTAITIATEMARQIIRVDGLVMVYDRKLYEKMEKEGKKVKSEKHQEKVRKYLKKNEEDMFSDLYHSK